MPITNIEQADYETGETGSDGSPWRYLDLSGEHLGVRIEELSPGATSSHHHYHTAEEEHVVVLDGEATLHLGEEAVPLTTGDHICFPAGEPVPHHIENSSTTPFRFIVFGERKTDDVVFYPKAQVMLVKSSEGPSQYRYEVREPGSD